MCIWIMVMFWLIEDLFADESGEKFRSYVEPTGCKLTCYWCIYYTIWIKVKKILSWFINRNFCTVIVLLIGCWYVHY